MEILAAILSGVGSGGILGLAGSLMSTFLKGRQAKQDALMWEKKQEWALTFSKLEHEQQSADRENEAKIEHRSDVTKGSYAGLTASLSHDAKISKDAPGWVNAIKALFRPFLTTALNAAWVAFTFKIFFSLEDPDSALITVLGREQAVDLLVYSVTSMVFLATTASIWWFGDRVGKPAGLKTVA